MADLCKHTLLMQTYNPTWTCLNHIISDFWKSYLGLLHCSSISSPIIQTLLSHFLTIGIKSKFHIYNITLLILNIPKALKSNYCNILSKLDSHNFARIIPKFHPWYSKKQKPIQNAYVNGTHLPQQLFHNNLKKCPIFFKYTKPKNKNTITNQLFQIP